jgi:serine/threonine protein kinase/tetratricopeptide (TPR) repeat protein
MNEEENSFPNTISHYRVLRKIGKGGMGEVYLAEDDRLFRKVALKILPAEFTKDPDRLRRFQNEARAASALNHPNILVVYDVGTEGQVPFIATEYVEGKTLRTQLSSGKMSLRETLEIAIQIASALASAHEAGIVHRDIKPENIMLRPDGYVKVLDFGLAKVTQTSGSTDITEVPTVTEAGTVMGTVKYMSPEQVRGLLVDARSDIFSLGVLLYETVAGVPPFEGKTRSDVIAAILGKEPLPLANHSVDVSQELDWIITKMLRKDQEDRYQTARELLNDLRVFKNKIEGSSELRRSGRDKMKKSLLIVAPEISFKFVFGALAVILLIVLGVYQFKKGTGNIDSIAVLPLVNVGKETEMEYLTDGITETIIRSLSQLPNLRVMAQSTVFRYKRREVDPQTVGKELGVHAVLTGKVIQHEDDLLITIELADARNNNYIWSHQYRDKASNLLFIQSDIATDISGRLRLGLSGDEKKLLAKNYTNNIEAYQLYLKGRYFWNKRTKEGFEKGIAYFRQALDTDPGYALAWSGLADSYIGLTFYQYAAPKEAMPKAKAASAKALEIDESLAEAHISQAHIAVNFDWQWAVSEKEFKRGIQLNPNYSTGHQWYAIHYLTPIARFDEALAELRRAHELDPLSPLMATFISATLYFARQYEEAARQCRRALELEPNFPVTHWHLGLIYEQIGKYDQAIFEHRKAVDLSGGSPRLIAALGHAYAIAGNREEAMRVIMQLNQSDYVSPLELAAISVALGEKERAFELLEEAYSERSFHITYIGVRPEFDSVRTDPRFADLMRRISLQP